MTHRFPLLPLLFTLNGAALACHSIPPTADLARLYERPARYHAPDRNPVILIPGILGSNLKQEGTGRVVWGAFEGDYASPKRADGAQLVALPMRHGAPLSELRDDVVQNGALDRIRIRLFGLPIGVGAYVSILSALGVGGYRDEGLGLAGAVDYGDDHFTCFQFAYDWRRDISETVAELHAFIEEREAYVRAEHAKRGHHVDKVRFDVVAHSMGGLVLRYYLRYGPHALPADGSLPELTWEGTEYIERALLIGTPNAGALGAHLQLLDGFKPGPFLPRYQPSILGTMPSIYQLLPRERHAAWEGVEAPLAPATWERLGWGLADPDQAKTLKLLLPGETPERRREIALDHQKKCLARATQLHRALDVPSSPPAGTELLLALGDASPTAARAVHGPDGRRRSLEYEAGDGTVLRTSALMDERRGGTWKPRLVSPVDWSQVSIYFRDHLGLTQDHAFTDNLLYLLLEDPRRATR